MQLISAAWTIVIFIMFTNMAAYLFGSAFGMKGIQDLAPQNPDQVRAQTLTLNSTYATQASQLDAFSFLSNAIFSHNIFSTLLNYASGGIIMPVLQSMGAPPIVVATVGLVISFILIGALTLIVRGMFG